MEPTFNALHLRRLTFVVALQEARLGRHSGLCQARGW